MKRGLGVQLPVYQLAVRQAGGEEYGRIACEYRFVTRRAKATELELKADEEQVTARLRRLVAAAVDLVDAGVFARAPAGLCDYCDVRYACGSTAWTRGRHRRHEALAPLVELQKHGPGDGGDDDAG